MPDHEGRDGRDHHIQRALEQAARDDEDQRQRQRNAGLAILVLAGLVVLLLAAIVMGGLPGG